MGHNTLTAGFDEISATLLKARATGRALPGPPAGLPSSLEDAYRIQDQSLDAQPLRRSPPPRLGLLERRVAVLQQPADEPGRHSPLRA